MSKHSTPTTKNNPPVVPRMSSAVLSNGATAVRLIDGLSCPNCGRVLRASDFELTGDSVRIVCAGDDCGRLIVEIEP
jgi:hypothetical protein